MKFWNTNLLRLLIIALAIPIVSPSCDSKVEEIYEFGKAYKAEDVMGALIEAAVMTNYSGAIEGEWVAMEHTSRTPGGDPSVGQYTDYHVLSRKEDEQFLEMGFVKKIYDADRVLKDQVEFEVQLEKSDALIANNINANKGGVTFHKLKVYRELLPAPREWANKPDCGGIENCKIPVVTVKFNMADQTDEEEPGVYVYTVHFPTEAIPGFWSTSIINLNMGPFPGHYKACLETILDNNDSDQLIEICETVVDMIRK